MGWKRTAMALVLALLVSCDAGSERAASSPRPQTSDLERPAGRFRMPVRGDFSVSRAVPDAEVRTVDALELRAGQGSVAFFALGRPPVPGRCLAEVRLRLFLEKWPDLAAQELALYPAQVFDALGKRNGDRFGYSGALLDVRPRATFEGVDAGWGEWDVTRIVKRWTTGSPFPSQGRRAPERGPVVLALRDADLAEPLVAATIASSESAHAPRALAFIEESCSG